MPKATITVTSDFMNEVDGLAEFLSSSDALLAIAQGIGYGLDKPVSTSSVEVCGVISPFGLLRPDITIHLRHTWEVTRAMKREKVRNMVKMEFVSLLVRTFPDISNNFTIIVEVDNWHGCGAEYVGTDANSDPETTWESEGFA